MARDKQRVFRKDKDYPIKSGPFKGFKGKIKEVNRGNTHNIEMELDMSDLPNSQVNEKIRVKEDEIDWDA